MSIRTIADRERAMESCQPTQVFPCRGIKSQLVCTLTLTRSTSYSTSSLGAGHFRHPLLRHHEGPIIPTHGPKLRPSRLFSVSLDPRGVDSRARTRSSSANG